MKNLVMKFKAHVKGPDWVGFGISLGILGITIVFTLFFDGVNYDTFKNGGMAHTSLIDLVKSILSNEDMSLSLVILLASTVLEGYSLRIKGDLKESVKRVILIVLPVIAVVILTMLIYKHRNTPDNMFKVHFFDTLVYIYLNIYLAVMKGDGGDGNEKRVTGA